MSLVILLNVNYVSVYGSNSMDSSIESLRFYTLEMPDEMYQELQSKLFLVSPLIKQELLHEKDIDSTELQLGAPISMNDENLSFYVPLLHKGKIVFMIQIGETKNVNQPYYFQFGKLISDKLEDLDKKMVYKLIGYKGELYAVSENETKSLSNKQTILENNLPISADSFDTPPFLSSEVDEKAYIEKANELIERDIIDFGLDRGKIIFPSESSIDNDHDHVQDITDHVNTELHLKDSKTYKEEIPSLPLGNISEYKIVDISKSEVFISLSNNNQVSAFSGTVTPFDTVPQMPVASLGMMYVENMKINGVGQCWIAASLSLHQFYRGRDLPFIPQSWIPMYHDIVHIYNEPKCAGGSSTDYMNLFQKLNIYGYEINQPLYHSTIQAFTSQQRPSIARLKNSNLDINIGHAVVVDGWFELNIPASPPSTGIRIMDPNVGLVSIFYAASGGEGYDFKYYVQGEEYYWANTIITNW